MNWGIEFEIDLRTEESVYEGNIRDAVVTELDSTLVPKPLPFYGPERDLVNFPRRQYPEYMAQTRLCVFPEGWFKFMYPKIGVSGPYTLGLGIALWAVQKEWMITDDAEFKHLLAFWGWCYIFSRSELGVFAQQFYEDLGKEDLENIRQFEKDAIDLREEAIAHEKEEQMRQESKKMLFAAKRENVSLQLEATYREAAMDIYTKVKRQLDYLVEIGKIDARVKQKFMVNWVIDQVRESVLKTSEKDTLKQCITDLNSLAARA